MLQEGDIICVYADEDTGAYESPGVELLQLLLLLTHVHFPRELLGPSEASGSYTHSKESKQPSEKHAASGSVELS